jgi:hypothetical protein
MPDTAVTNASRLRPASVLRDILTGEAGGGIALMVAAAAGLGIANSASPRPISPRSRLPLAGFSPSRRRPSCRTN